MERAILVDGRFSDFHFWPLLLSKSSFVWEAYSRDLNTHLDNYRKSKRTMSRGSAYNDWNLLESGNLVHEIIYSRGNVACVFLVQQCKLLQKFMEIFPLIPDIGGGNI